MLMITVLFVRTVTRKSIMAKHIIYNECYIIKFNNHSYEAFILNADDDVEFKFFTNLSNVKHWIDKYNVPNNG